MNVSMKGENWLVLLDEGCDCLTATVITVIQDIELGLVRRCMGNQDGLPGINQRRNPAEILFNGSTREHIPLNIDKVYTPISRHVWWTAGRWDLAGNIELLPILGPKVC